jgi:hypothetical protein
MLFSKRSEMGMFCGKVVKGAMCGQDIGEYVYSFRNHRPHQSPYDECNIADTYRQS